jgi:hypothetical protein
MTASLDTYPKLDGFGFSAGDNMASLKDAGQAWTWNAYGKPALGGTGAIKCNEVAIMGIKNEFKKKHQIG